MVKFRRILATAGAATFLAATTGAAATEPAQSLPARDAGQASQAARVETPIWIRGDDVSRAEALIGALRQAHVHALPVSEYQPDRLEALLERTDAASRERTERALTRAYLEYARDITSGVLEPAQAANGVRRSAPPVDERRLLREAAAAPDITAHLMTLPPQDPGYFALVRRYAELREGPDWGAPLPEGPTLRAGHQGPEVTALRRRLAALGDHDPAGAADPERFDAALAEDVRAFQRRHGLNEDGAVGPRTREALNASPDFRARQIAVNLERSRWMNFDLGERRIIVNQPDYTVTLIDGGRVLFHERVVVGAPRHETPEFSDEMEYLVLNPSWNIPRSIATQELLPQLQEDPGLLARRNMVLARNDGGPVPENPSAHDFTQYSASSFPYHIRQQPDPDNALGDVKFMFPNDYAIYLHDTPSKHLFAKDRRAFSHGCVRVQDPMRLAELLLGEQMADPRGFIDRTLASDRESYVQLDRHLPVHLVYRTAWVDPAGRDQFREDVYGRDAEVMAALQATGVETLRR